MVPLITSLVSKGAKARTIQGHPRYFSIFFSLPVLLIKISAFRIIVINVVIISATESNSYYKQINKTQEHSGHLLKNIFPVFTYWICCVRCLLYQQWHKEYPSIFHVSSSFLTSNLCSLISLCKRKKVSRNLHRSIRKRDLPFRAREGQGEGVNDESTSEAEEQERSQREGRGGAKGGRRERRRWGLQDWNGWREKRKTWHMNISTAPRSGANSPISLISQPLVGHFPGLPSALCPNRPSLWDERHPRY